jgi:hypothetical protein
LNGCICRFVEKSNLRDSAGNQLLLSTRLKNIQSHPDNYLPVNSYQLLHLTVRINSGGAWSYVGHN